MTKKEKSARLVSKFEHVLSCPHCSTPMKVVDLKSLVCLNRHTFDFAKQGYVYMLTSQVNSHYDKELFQARQNVIMESHLYELLHKTISEVIKQHIHELAVEPIKVLDAGCGEGSHLIHILEQLNSERVTGFGLDISKEGIRLAAKKSGEAIWIVGDLANAPFAEESFQVILNILSPANYKEFKRILAPNSLLVKVVPRSNYFKELREALYRNKQKRAYTNDEIVSLYKQHFQLIDMFNLCYTRELTQAELINVVRMSPLAWNLNKNPMELNSLGVSEITVDLDILVGINNIV